MFLIIFYVKVLDSCLDDFIFYDCFVEEVVW